MAVALAFRLALYLLPRGHVAVSTATAGGGGASLALPMDYLRQRLLEDASDEDISAELSDRVGYPVVVATFNEPFVLRRLQASFTMDSGVLGGEDVRVVTWHLIKLAGGNPVDTWVDADFVAARAALLTFWEARRPDFTAKMSLTRIAFYRAGPGVIPPQPPVYASDHALAGTGSATQMMAPQTAISVMEKFAGVRKNHGRFFFPAGRAAIVSNEFGRPLGSYISTLATDLDTMYTAWQTNNTPAVVYLPALPERSPDADDPRYRTKGTFPPRAASARTVDEITVDNVFDVIRSRRYDRSTDRQTRVIGA